MKSNSSECSKRDSYEALAKTWGAAKNATAANRIFRQLHALARELRSTDDGRACLETLASSPDRPVRFQAASESLAWDSSVAVTSLIEMSEDGLEYTFDAAMTLQEYRAGRMRFDW